MRSATWMIRIALVLGLSSFQIAAHAVNIIENGEFNGGHFPWEPPGFWTGGNGIAGVDSQGRFCTTITALDSADWAVQLRQLHRPFIAGAAYTVRFKAWSSVPVNLHFSAADETAGFVWIFGTDFGVNAPLAGAPQEFEFNFAAGAGTNDGNFRFLMGNPRVPLNETVCFDDVEVIAPGANLLANSTFDGGVLLPPAEVGFFDGSSGTTAFDAGRFCINVDNPGNNEWSLQYRENNIAYTAGRTYEFNADVWSSNPVNLQVAGVDETSGFVWVFGSDFPVNAPLGGAPEHLSANFTAGADAENGKFRFLFGNGRVPAGTTVCLDNLQLIDPEGSEEEPEIPPPPVHVNQLGYLPLEHKRASYALPEAADTVTGRIWHLMQGDVVVTSGMTAPHSAHIDAASGDWVHTIDFSSVTAEGEGYTLVVVESSESYTSEPFTIGSGIYSELKYDALAYFYHNRSGTPILADVVGDEWARPAGHVGDTAVQTLACLDGSAGCTTRDVSGGWYDAGDHGKYVVNGGISVWTLLNQYERSRYLGENLDSFADGSMQLPPEEGSNGVSDLLDEARWEIEWFFKMQVPSGQPHVGMVYHKMHDLNWTGIPTAPHADPQPRYIHPPSTAATLNFAAVGAQCFRAYSKVDREFALECLARAIRAYHAAKTNPILMASNVSNGGGTYDDFDVTDEFYWAATELYLATGLPSYAKDMRTSPLHLTVPVNDTSLMSWQRTNALGMLSMVTVGDKWPVLGRHSQWVKQARAAVLQAADKYAASVASEAYATPISPARYPWGSNSFVVNNLIVLGLAHDFSCKDKYVDAMVDGIDYLFGRNPMGHSYVTGYGTRAEQFPHHRFWAGALNSSFPLAPPGAMSGGPNSNIEDPLAQALLQGCAPQRCFIDHIDAWSVNEITINWNAPFAWVAAYMDEYATGEDDHDNCKPRHGGGHSGGHGHSHNGHDHHNHHGNGHGKNDKKGKKH
jgi:endoglucanase